MISIRNLTHLIGGKMILDDISLDIPRRGITALIGPNGAGKSTLVNLMARQIPLQTGEVKVNEIDLSTANANTLAKPLTLVGQHVGVASRLRVDELIGFGRWPHTRGRLGRQDKEIIDDAIAAFSLCDLRHRFLDQLSGGQRQRAFVAMACAQETDWLLLDEPLNNLDMYHAHSLMKTLHDLPHKNGKSIVVVIHDINQATAWADHIVSMKNGRIISTGTPAEVISPDSLQELYGLRPKTTEIDGQIAVLVAR